VEHRWGQRVVSQAAVRLKGHSCGCAWGRLLDVSISGALIESGLDLPLGARITVETLGSDRTFTSPCDVRASVVRTGPGVMAVEWLDFAPAPMVALLAERSHLAQRLQERGLESNEAA